jgi:hypothetical protein
LKDCIELATDPVCDVNGTSRLGRALRPTDILKSDFWRDYRRLNEPKLLGRDGRYTYAPARGAATAGRTMVVLRWTIVVLRTTGAG